MPISYLSDDEIRKTLDAMEVHGSIRATAKALGLARTTVRRHLDRAELRSDAPAPEVTFPLHPEDDIPVGEIIDIMTRRAGKRLEAAASRRAQVVGIKSSVPIVLAFVGDPHLDDDGCDWPMLREHIALLSRPNVYAVNVGDTTNNWTGKLMRLYASQETSLKTARKLARWFLTESGVRWLVWVMGNHDDWNSGADILRLMNAPGIVMDDWSARFTIKFGNGVEVPVWVAHDFPGSSQWNRMHGLMKAAVMRGGAMLYAAGHRHTPGLHWEPIEDQGTSYWAFRSKGYKALDSHAVRLGHGWVDDGQTTAAVINPGAKDPRELVQGFKSLRAAVAYRDGIA